MTAAPGLDAGALGLAVAPGPKYWCGLDAPMPGCVTSQRLVDRHAGFREAPEMHGVFSAVYLVEHDLGHFRQWPLIVDEALRLLRPEGTLVLRYRQSQHLVTHEVLGMIGRRSRDRARIVLDQRWPAEYTRLVGVAVQQEPRPNQVTSMTFGLVTDGRQPGRVADFVDSVTAIRGIDGISAEVLVCGPPGSTDHVGSPVADVRLVEQPTENADKGWITRKKNLLVQAARGEHVVVAHDRYTMTPGLLEGLNRFGGDFDVLVPRQTTTRGFRYPDWVTIGSDVILGPQAELDYDDYDPRLYVNGGIVLARTAVLRDVPWNELLFWGDAEDVELTRRWMAAGHVPRVAPGVEVRTFTTRADQIGIFDRPLGAEFSDSPGPREGIAIGERVDLRTARHTAAVTTGPGWGHSGQGRTWHGTGAAEVVLKMASTVPPDRRFALRLTLTDPSPDAPAPRALINDVQLELLGCAWTEDGTTWSFALTPEMLVLPTTARLHLRDLAPGAALVGLVVDELDEPEEEVSAFSFGSGTRADHGYADGWAPAEDWGRWSVGPVATLRLRMAATGQDVTLSATVRAFLPAADEPQVVTVLADGTPVGSWTFADTADSERTLHIPAAALDSRWLALSFHITRPTSPGRRGLGRDDRALGLGLCGLRSSLPFAARTPAAAGRP